MTATLLAPAQTNSAPIPGVLCACGCGRPAPIAQRTISSRGCVRGAPQTYIRGHQPKRRGEGHHGWRGGRRSGGRQYVQIRRPDHPNASNGYVYEHILMVESAIGHALDGRHPVHHVDGNGSHNVNTNLVACEDAAYHLLLHKRTRAWLACGDASAVACRYCKKYEQQDQMHRYVTGSGNIVGYHHDCSTRRGRVS